MSERLTSQDYLVAEVKRLISIAEMNGLSATARALHRARVVASIDEGAYEGFENLTSEEIEDMLSNVIEIYRPGVPTSL